MLQFSSIFNLSAMMNSNNDKNVPPSVPPPPLPHSHMFLIVPNSLTLLVNLRLLYHFSLHKESGDPNCVTCAIPVYIYSGVDNAVF